MTDLAAELAQARRERDEALRAVQRLADRPIPFTFLERIDRWFNGPRHRDIRSDRPRRI